MNILGRKTPQDFLRGGVDLYVAIPLSILDSISWFLSKRLQCLRVREMLRTFQWQNQGW